MSLHAPVGWEYQNGETGLITVCINDGVNGRDSFERLNPRHHYVGPLYRHQAGADEVNWIRRERAIRSAVMKGLADLVGLHEPEAVRNRLGRHWLNEMIERERVVDIVLRIRREVEEAAPYTAALNPGGSRE